MAAGLTVEQVEKFKNDGFLVLENFCSNEEIEEMKLQMYNIVEQMDISSHPKVIFSTTSPKQINDEYFLTSGDKIRYFFEENVFDDKGKLKVEKHKALNKVGHALHVFDPVFKKITFSKRIQAIVKSLGMKKPAVPQSMYIFKQPGIGGEVIPHQDSTFLHTSPLNLLGFWIPLEDCTLENGCLRFFPGSHKEGVAIRMVRDLDGEAPSTKFTNSFPVHYDENKFIPQLTKKGCLVLIHGEVVHRSLPNKSNKSRHAYTFHIVEQENVEYSKDNWLQPTPEVPFPALYTD